MGVSGPISGRFATALAVLARAREMAEREDPLGAAQLLGRLLPLPEGALVGRAYLLAERGRLLQQAARALHEGEEDEDERPRHHARARASSTSEARALLDAAESSLRGALVERECGRALRGEALMRLGAVLLDLERPEDAELALHGALVVDPTAPDRLILLGGAAALTGDWGFADCCFRASQCLGRDPSAVLPGVPESAARSADVPPARWGLGAVAVLFRDLDLVLLGLSRDTERALDLIGAMRSSSCPRFGAGVFGLLPLTAGQAARLYPHQWSMLEARTRPDTLPFSATDARLGHVDPTMGLRLHFLGATFPWMDPVTLECHRLAGMRVGWERLGPRALRAIPQLEHLAGRGSVMGRFTYGPRATSQAALVDEAWRESVLVGRVLSAMGLPRPTSAQAIDCTPMLALGRAPPATRRRSTFAPPPSPA